MVNRKLEALYQGHWPPSMKKDIYVQKNRKEKKNNAGTACSWREMQSLSCSVTRGNDVHYMMWRVGK